MSPKMFAEIGGGVGVALADGASGRSALELAQVLVADLAAGLNELGHSAPWPDSVGVQPAAVIACMGHLAGLAEVMMSLGMSDLAHAQAATAKATRRRGAT